MDIEKQQFVTDPSGALGKLQSTLSIDQSIGRRALQRNSCWRPHRVRASVLGITRLFQLD